MRRSEIDAALQKVYDRIPGIPDCQGRCWLSCGAIEMNSRERQRIREAGYRISSPEAAEAAAEASGEDFWCEALTEDHRCAVYAIRPLVCRLWGAMERMKCPYGCVPAGGWLSDLEAAELVEEAERIGGYQGVHRKPIDGPEAIKIIMKAKKGQRTELLRVTRTTIPPAFRRPPKGLAE